ncbi:MAG TPA: cupin domain-containing protein [Bryobacteraceae bacterium]|nr:cupin domain-containing protein [Bryobacteraceae bacterium]
MDQYNWESLPEERMNPTITRKVVHTERMTIARLRLAKGAIVPLHHHENEQVSIIEAGALRFEVDGQETVVRAGEALRIPSNAPHLVEALEDSVATDLFTPRREDWIRGDDAYLRR